MFSDPPNEKNNDLETTFSITDNYSIKVPYKFIDCFTKDILHVPVIASDTCSYEARELLNLFNQNQDGSGSPMYGKQVKLNKNLIIFNFDLYQQIREFFSKVLERDRALLMDGNHNEALKIIKELANGLTQNDKRVIQLIEMCKTNKLEVSGLFVLPKQTDISIPINEPSASAPHYLSSDTCIAIKRLILSGVVLNDIAYYITYAISPSFASDPLSYLFAPIFLSTGIINSIGSIFFLPAHINRTAIFGFVPPLVNSAINCGVSYLSGLPAWSTPFITAPIIGAVTFGVPEIIKRCTVIPNRFSLWHRETQPILTNPTQTNVEERLLPRPGSQRI